MIAFGGGADLEDSLRRVLAAGPAEAIATLGEGGSLRAFRSGEIAFQRIPAFPAPPPIDPTGCGDSYLSGLCAAAALGAVPADAPLLGAWTAARVAAVSGLEALVTLRGGRDRAARDEPRLAALAACAAADPAADPAAGSPGARSPSAAPRGSRPAGDPPAYGGR